MQYNSDGTAACNTAESAFDISNSSIPTGLYQKLAAQGFMDSPQHFQSLLLFLQNHNPSEVRKELSDYLTPGDILLLRTGGMGSHPTSSSDVYSTMDIEDVQNIHMPEPSSTKPLQRPAQQSSDKAQITKQPVEHAFRYDSERNGSKTSEGRTSCSGVKDISKEEAYIVVKIEEGAFLDLNKGHVGKVEVTVHAVCCEPELDGRHLPHPYLHLDSPNCKNGIYKQTHPGNQDIRIPLIKVKRNKQNEYENWLKVLDQEGVDYYNKIPDLLKEDPALLKKKFKTDSMRFSICLKKEDQQDIWCILYTDPVNDDKNMKKREIGLQEIKPPYAPANVKTGLVLLGKNFKKDDEVVFEEPNTQWSVSVPVQQNYKGALEIDSPVYNGGTKTERVEVLVYVKRISQGNMPEQRSPRIPFAFISDEYGVYEKRIRKKMKGTYKSLTTQSDVIKNRSHHVPVNPGFGHPVIKDQLKKFITERNWGKLGTGGNEEIQCVTMHQDEYLSTVCDGGGQNTRAVDTQNKAAVMCDGAYQGVVSTDGENLSGAMPDGRGQKEASTGEEIQPDGRDPNTSATGAEMPYSLIHSVGYQSTLSPNDGTDEIQCLTMHQDEYRSTVRDGGGQNTRAADTQNKAAVMHDGAYQQMSTDGENLSGAMPDGRGQNEASAGEEIPQDDRDPNTSATGAEMSYSLIHSVGYQSTLSPNDGTDCEPYANTNLQPSQITEYQFTKDQMDKIFSAGILGESGTWNGQPQNDLSLINPAEILKPPSDPPDQIFNTE